MRIIKVTLSRTRQFPGSLELWEQIPGTTCATFPEGTLNRIFGPVPVLGKADSLAAAQHGNATRDPLRAYGDTPTGQYSCRLEPAASGPDAIRSFGTHQRILLTPIGGQALEAAKDGDPAVLNDGHRLGLMLHGGAPGNGGGLRPTHGCLRLSNDDQAALVALFQEPTTCQVTELTPPPAITSSAVPTASQIGGSPLMAKPSSGAGPVSAGFQNTQQKIAKVLQNPAQLAKAA